MRAVWVRERGFTLIELLIVVAIIGIIAALAIPSMLNAIDRGRQKRTMADIRAIATAIEAYSVDLSYYPSNVTSLTPVSGSLQTHVVPLYLATLPGVDGWGRDIFFQSDAGGSEFTLRSYGKEGAPSASLGETHEFDCDIIFQAGRFIALPDGIQT